MRNDSLAAAVGVILAAALAGLTRPGSLAPLGSLIGALTGLYLALWAPGVAQLLSLAPSPSDLSPFWQVLVSGLVGAVYGYLAGVVLALYHKGQGPCF
jgi:hypothetical protein